MRLDVYYCGAGEHQLVGELLETATGQIYFEYAVDWREGVRELSPVHLPNATNFAVTTKHAGFSPLHGLFADSLPDWWGEQLMRRKFELAGIPWRRVTALQKLACQGARSIGALSYEPSLADDSFRSSLTVDVSEMVKSAQQVVFGQLDDIAPALLRGGISPGGAQPKVLISLRESDLAERIDGQLEVHALGDSLEAGFVPYLLKFDLDDELALGREEFAYAMMARAAGIDMAPCSLLETSDGRAHFLTQRFDWGAGGRRHLHSYSGLMHTAVRDGLDYSDLMDLARGLTRDERDVEKLFRRAVFNVLAGNDDDHGKNHAFIMEADGSWKLSPAYDLTLATNPLVSGVRAAAVNGKRCDLSRGDLIKLAGEQGVRRAGDVIDEVQEVVRSWPEFAQQAGLPAHLTSQVADEIGEFSS